MPKAVPIPTRKRPGTLTLKKVLVAEANVCTSNLSATMEALPADYVG
jgi:hypothetical protein